MNVLWNEDHERAEIGASRICVLCGERFFRWEWRERTDDGDAHYHCVFPEYPQDRGAVSTFVDLEHPRPSDPASDGTRRASARSRR